MEDLFAQPTQPRGPLTVRELVGGVRELLEERLRSVRVVGEVSDLFRARSGHSYFTLKDGSAQIKAVLFAGTAARIPFDPENGLEIIVRGEVTVYAQRGDLQLLVRGLEPVGRGELQLAFEQLRSRLGDEGLFDPALKRALPIFPRRIGIVTSPSGAAVRDVVQVSGKRFPGTPLLISPTRVQGEGSENEIAEALGRVVEAADDLDVVLLVRGGGSLEDLWAFNTERVARAIRACPVPVVSGVGHETDVTIADLAADVRAPTPSAAAMLALPDGEAWADQLDGIRRRLEFGGHRVLERARNRVGSGQAGLRANAPAARLAANRTRFEAARRAWERAAAAAIPERRTRLERAGLTHGRAMAGWVPPLRERAGALSARVERAAESVVAARRARFEAAVAGLDALSPLAVLSRGYAIARAEDGAVLREPGQVSAGDAIQVRIEHATLMAEVTDVVPAAEDSADRE